MMFIYIAWFLRWSRFPKTTASNSMNMILKCLVVQWKRENRRPGTESENTYNCPNIVAFETLPLEGYSSRSKQWRNTDHLRKKGVVSTVCTCANSPEILWTTVLYPCNHDVKLLNLSTQLNFLGSNNGFIAHCSLPSRGLVALACISGQSK